MHVPYLNKRMIVTLFIVSFFVGGLSALHASVPDAMARQRLSPSVELTSVAIGGNVPLLPATLAADFAPDGTVIRILTVDSEPRGVRIESPTCQSGTTLYTKTVAHSANVILQAPEFIGEGGGRMRFVKWSGLVESTNPTIGFQVNGDETVKAHYEQSPIHILTVDSDPRGVRIESPTCQSGTTLYTKTVAHGANVILQAPEFIGEGEGLMRFVRWSGLVESTNPEIGFQVNADASVKAHYEQAVIHTLTVDSDPRGVRIESPTCQSGTTLYTKTVAHGANVILQAPELIGEGGDQMRFVRWSGLVESTNPEIGFQVNGDATVKAHYERVTVIHTLTVDSDPRGVRIESPTCQSGTTLYTKTVAHGANVILQAPPFIGEGSGLMRFVRWSGLVESTNTEIGFQVNADATVKAHYELVPVIHTLTVDSDPRGVRIESPTCQSGTTLYTKTVAHGANVILQAPELIGEGASAMRFVRWSGLVESTNPEIGFQVNGDATVKAHYEPTIIRTLTVDSEPRGVRIESPTCHSGTTLYTKTMATGTNVILQAPEFIGEGDDRMRFVRWSGLVESTNLEIGFQVNEDATVKAHYVALSAIRTLTVDSDPRGVRIESPTCHSGTTLYTKTVATGTNVILQAPEFIGEDDTLMRFVRWSGLVESTNLEIGFQVNEDATVKAHYEQAIIHTLTVDSDPRGVRIESPTCHSGITLYTKTVATGTNVILQAPEFIGEGESRMRFVRWSGLVDSTNLEIGFQVNADATVKAHYVALSTIRTLTVDSDPRGVRIESPTCHSGTTLYTKTVATGTNVILQAPEFIGEGEERMRFVRWSGLVESTNLEIGFQVNADATVKAHYVLAPIQTITVDSDPVGVRIESSTCQSGTTSYVKTVARGANVYLEAPEFIGTGESRMRFVRWSGFVESTDRLIGFQVNSDVYLKVHYELVQEEQSVIYAFTERGYRYGGTTTPIARSGALVVDVLRGFTTLLTTTGDGSGNVEEWDSEPGCWYTIATDPSTRYWVLTNGAVTSMPAASQGQHHHAEMTGMLTRTKIAIGGGVTGQVPLTLQGMRRAGNLSGDGFVVLTSLNAKLMSRQTIEANENARSHAQIVESLAAELGLSLDAIGEPEFASSSAHVPQVAPSASVSTDEGVLCYRLNSRGFQAGNGEILGNAGAGFLLIDRATHEAEALFAWREGNQWRYHVQDWRGGVNLAGTVTLGSSRIALIGARQELGESAVISANHAFQYQLLYGTVSQVTIGGEQVSLAMQLSGTQSQHVALHCSEGIYSSGTFSATASAETITFVKERFSLDQAKEWLIVNRLPSGALVTDQR